MEQFLKKTLGKGWFAAFMAAVLILCTVMPVFAVTGEKDKLVVTVTTDKETYSAGDEVQLLVKAKNTGKEAVENVKVKVSQLPEGIKLAKGASDTITLGDVAVNAEVSGTVKAVAEKSVVSSDKTIAGNVKTGDSVSGAYFMAAILAAAVLVIVIRKNKKAAGTIVMIALVIGTLFTSSIYAAGPSGRFEIKVPVKVDKKDTEIIVLVTYGKESESGTNVVEKPSTGEDATKPPSGEDNTEKPNPPSQEEVYGKVTVHDPSIVKDPETGMYYIFGTHMSWAKSKDLMNWTLFTNNINRDNAAIFAESVKWAKRGNANYNLQGNLWAPDVIWNKDMNKWCMYMSVNSDGWYSSIALLTADHLDGDWTYVGTVVYSGFTNEEEAKATDFVKVTGGTDVSRYLQNRNGQRTYGMNAIDPCVFYDEEGTLWMTYGSWFGGIYMLKLDKATGLRDYNYTYETAENKSDIYQGIKLAGGDQRSGEASYIEHIGDYYYLFMTYGGLESTGGYNMRVFRSENVTGPYTDPSGDDARYSAGSPNAGNVSGSTGLRLMSYYKWSHMSYGYCAQGHNSAFVDEDGKAYVIYHTRFDNQGEGHQVRVHQLFQTKDGWLIAAPYEYSGETLPQNGYTAEQIVGSYEVLTHRSNINFANKECVTGQVISFNEDGTVSGAKKGSWTKEDGTPYVSVVLDGVAYNGVFIEQKKEETTETVMTFTLLGDNELTVWGSKLIGDDEKMLKDDMALFTLPSSALQDIELVNAGFYGSKITYESKNPNVLSNDGKINRGEANQTVTVTVTFTHGAASASKDYQITVIGTGSANGKVLVGEYFTDEPYNLANAMTVLNPFNKDVTAGLEIYKGVSIEFDVEGTGNITSNILSFNNDVKVDGNCLYFTGGSYLGYNADGGFFDANRNADWSMAADYIKGKARIRIDITGSGFEVYANNELAYSNKTLNNSTLSTSDGFGGYSVVLPWLNEKARELSFGTGNWWDDKFNGTISNVKLYANEINEPIKQWTYNNYKAESSYYEDGMKVFPHDNSGGSRGVNTAFKDEYKLNHSYKVELDFAMTAGYAGSQGSNNEFVIAGKDISYSNKNINYGAESNYILRLSTGSIKADTDIYYVNGSSQTVKLPKSKLVHLEMIVDADGDVQAVFTVDNVSTTVNTHVNGTSGLEGIYLLVGRNQGIIKIGNISVVPDNTDVSGGTSAKLVYTTLADYDFTASKLPEGVTLGTDEDRVTAEATSNGVKLTNGYINLPKDLFANLDNDAEKLCVEIRFSKQNSQWPDSQWSERLFNFTDDNDAVDGVQTGTNGFSLSYNGNLGTTKNPYINDTSKAYLDGALGGRIDLDKVVTVKAELDFTTNTGTLYLDGELVNSGVSSDTITVQDLKKFTINSIGRSFDMWSMWGFMTIENFKVSYAKTVEVAD